MLTDLEAILRGTRSTRPNATLRAALQLTYSGVSLRNTYCAYSAYIRTPGRSIPTVSIRVKATALARDMNINDCQGGPSWCFHFMKRRNLSILTRTTVSQQLPIDYEEKLANFRAYCKNKITEKKIEPEHFAFDIPVNTTVEKTETRKVFIRSTGNEKSSFNVVLGCQANSQKLCQLLFSCIRLCLIFLSVTNEQGWELL